MLKFIKNLFYPEDDYVSCKITRTPYIAQQEEILHENIKIIDRACPCCGNVRTEGFFDGLPMLTDYKYNYMHSECKLCGAKWETKILRTK